jgi:hypothetical protein
VEVHLWRASNSTWMHCKIIMWLCIMLISYSRQYTLSVIFSTTTLVSKYSNLSENPMWYVAIFVVFTSKWVQYHMVYIIPTWFCFLLWHKVRVLNIMTCFDELYRSCGFILCEYRKVQGFLYSTSKRL